MPPNLSRTVALTVRIALPRCIQEGAGSIVTRLAAHPAKMRRAIMSETGPSPSQEHQDYFTRQCTSLSCSRYVCMSRSRPPFGAWPWSFSTLLMQTVLQDGHTRLDMLANRNAHLHLGLFEAFLDAANMNNSHVHAFALLPAPRL